MPRQPRSVVLAVVHRQILVTDIVPALEGTSGISGPRSRCACDRTTAVSSMFEGYGYNHGLACVEVGVEVFAITANRLGREGHLCD